MFVHWPKHNWSFATTRGVLTTACVAALLFGSASAFAVDYIRGFDAYNGDGVVNWTTAKNAGIQFAFVKATEGKDFVDGRFISNMQGATNAGVYIGPYHICRVDSNVGNIDSYSGQPFAVDSTPWLDATSEAIDFIEAIRPYYRSGNYLPPVADIETNIIERLPFSNTLRKAFVSNWLQIFSDTVQNALGVRPMVYTSKSSANTYYSDTIAANHKLWIAWWKGTGTTSPPLQSDTPKWPSWAFWQYTNEESVPGVPGSEGPNNDLEDGDVFYGTQQQLTSLLVHNVPGDYNHNGKVDGGDYIVWRNSIGSTVNLAADGNSNSIIDSGDFTYWRARFGQTAGSGSGAGDVSSGGVPEPASAVGAFVAITIGLLRRQRR